MSIHCPRGPAAAIILALALSACASDGPAPTAERADPRYTRDIYTCMFSNRHPESDSLLSGRVMAGAYNACMEARGWREAPPQADVAAPPPGA